MNGPMEHKLITCILPKGTAGSVAVRLDEEHGIRTTNISYARGVGKITPLARRGVGEQTEKEILSVVVASEVADDLFQFIFDAADVGRPHGGLIFMGPLERTTRFALPDLPAEF